MVLRPSVTRVPDPLCAKLFPSRAQFNQILAQQENPPLRLRKHPDNGVAAAWMQVRIVISSRVGSRPVRPGMRWTGAGANAIIALHCSRPNARFAPRTRGRHPAWTDARPRRQGPRRRSTDEQEESPS